MICLVFWMPRTLKLKVQYIVGLALYLLTSPFLTILTLLYALYHLNHFGWGKTRKTIEVETDSTTDIIIESQSRNNVSSNESDTFIPSGANTPYPNSQISDEEQMIGIARPARAFL
jgi:hypothetical protein